MIKILDLPYCSFCGVLFEYEKMFGNWIINVCFFFLFLSLTTLSFLHFFVLFSFFLFFFFFLSFFIFFLSYFLSVSLSIYLYFFLSYFILAFSILHRYIKTSRLTPMHFHTLNDNTLHCFVFHWVSGVVADPHLSRSSSSPWYLW